MMIWRRRIGRLRRFVWGRRNEWGFGRKGFYERLDVISQTAIGRLGLGFGRRKLDYRILIIGRRLGWAQSTCMVSEMLV
jgi:hypothetical protein